MSTLDLGAIDRSATRTDGWMRRAPARFKLIGLVAVLATILGSSGIVVPLAVLATLTVVAVTTRVDLRIAMPLALYPAIFAMLFAFSSAAGLQTGAVMVARAVCAAFGAVLVVLTTPYPQVFAPIQRIVPGLVGDALLLTYRSLFLLLDQFARMSRAMRLRSGGDPRGIGARLRTAGTVLGNLLLYSMDLAQRSYDVMRVRGYSGRLRTTGGVRHRDPATTASPERDPLMNTHNGSADADEHDVAASVSCVRHSYEDGTTIHLCGLDFVARRGERTVLLGPNGSGKTTLLYHLLGLLKSREGRVRVLGVDPGSQWTRIRERIGVVLQNAEEQLIMPTVFDDVAFSPRQYGMAEEDVLARTREALDRLGISHLAQRVPHSLSGGEKRRVALAGALVLEPELLVLDEPFEGLDPSARAGIVTLLKELAHERGTAVVMSTHDIDAVAELADYCYVLKTGGEIAVKGTPGEVFARAEEIAHSNIRPPVLAELFTALRAIDPDAPLSALTVPDAVAALTAWKAESVSPR